MSTTEKSGGEVATEKQPAAPPSEATPPGEELNSTKGSNGQAAKATAAETRSNGKSTPNAEDGTHQNGGGGEFNPPGLVPSNHDDETGSRSDNLDLSIKSQSGRFQSSSSKGPSPTAPGGERKLTGKGALLLGTIIGKSRKSTTSELGNSNSSPVNPPNSSGGAGADSSKQLSPTDNAGSASAAASRHGSQVRSVNDTSVQSTEDDAVVLDTSKKRASTVLGQSTISVDDMNTSTASPTFRVSKVTMSATEINDRQEKLKKAILASRVAAKKVQRIFANAEELILTGIEATMKHRADPSPIVRVFADEYMKVCRMHSSQCYPPNFHERFCRLIDESRTLRWDLTGVSEIVKTQHSDSKMLSREIMDTAKPVAMQILREQPLPENVKACSSRTWIDLHAQLVIQFWPNAEAPKRYVKSLNRFMNYALSEFHVPAVVLFEICGRSFTASTIAPLSDGVRTNTLLEDEWWRFLLHNALCETHFVPQPSELNSNARFAYGYDGRLYCCNATGLVSNDITDEFLAEYEGQSENFEEVKKMTPAGSDRVCTDLIAMSRANQPKVSSVLHKFGLKVQHLHVIHGSLSQAELVREGTAGLAEDVNLQSALRAIIAEILARVIKQVLRNQFQGIAPADDEFMAMQMGAFATQLVVSQIIEDADKGANSFLYNNTKLAAMKLFPHFFISKKALWTEEFVSEQIIGQRVAQMIGLGYVSGVIAGITSCRLVRATALPLEHRRLGALRGRQREMMQKLVSRVKSARKFSPHCVIGLTIELIDLFHQTSGKNSTNGSPQAIFEQLLMSTVKQRDEKEKQALQEKEKASGGKGSNTKYQKSSLPPTPTSQDQNGGGRPDSPNSSDLNSDDYNLRHTQIDFSAATVLFLQELHLFSAKLSDDVPLIQDRFRGYIDVCQVVLKGQEDQPQSQALHPFLIASRVRTLRLASKIFPTQMGLAHALENAVSMLNSLARAGRVKEHQAYWMWEAAYEGIATSYSAIKPGLAPESLKLLLEHSTKLFGSQSLAVASTHNEIAATLCAQGDLVGAEEEFRQAFDLFVELNDVSHTALTTANNLGYTYFRMGDALMPPKLKKKRYMLLRFKLPEEVEVKLDQAADMFGFVMEHKGRAEPKVLADAFNNMGTVWLYRGKYARALDDILVSLQLTKGTLSDDHPDRAGALHNMKMAEKRLKGNAALFIECWYRRYVARRYTQLLRNGKRFAELFQRLGRGYFLRVQLYWLAEKKRMKRAHGKAMDSYQTNTVENDFDESDTKKLEEDLKLDDDDSDVEDGGDYVQATFAGRKKPSDGTLNNSTGEEKVTSLGPEDSSKISAASILLQAVGRGCLTRKMIYELNAMKKLRSKK